ncbi:MAG: HNH endonuclease [Phycisphaerales bacterium]|nr:HNH endonuclease [Phycisphaerales bacterium]
MPTMPKQHRPRTLQAPPGVGRPSATRRGYGARWQRWRRLVLRERIWCADPFGHHESDGRRLVIAEHVDHIVPLADGGANDASNLQCLCATCHARKTVFHDGGFGRARRRMTTTVQCVVRGPQRQETEAQEHV